MLSKLFDARQKIKKLSFEEFSKYLNNNRLSSEDYLNLLREIYSNKRQMFINYMNLLSSYEESIISTDFEEYPLFLHLCRKGTLAQVQALSKIINFKIQSYCSQNPLYHCLQNKSIRKNEKRQSSQIIKFLLSVEKQLIGWKIQRPLLLCSLQKNQLECAIILIQKGAPCNVVDQNDNNLLHLLYKMYNKKNQKLILELRSLLMQRGVDEKKINLQGRKPLYQCNQLQKKILASEPRRKNTYKQEISKVKGKSQQGWQSIQKIKDEKTIISPNNEGYNSLVIKLDNRYDQMEIQRQADYVLEKAAKQKQREIKKKKLQKEKQKDKCKKRVLTPDQLKFYLQQDIIYETDIIESQNRRLNDFFNQLIDKIIQQIKQRNSVDVEVYGSFATGLCLPESDIDMVIVPKQDYSYNPFTLLHDIHTHLETMKDEIQNSKFIKTASVPIIKMQCTSKYYEKKIDITFQDGNHNGRESVKLIQKYLEVYPQLRSLTIILKQFIYSAQLSDPYCGGISSYGLIFMIVAYIQHDNRERKFMGNQSLATSAQLLIGFLRYYGFKCNYIGKKICVLEPEQAEAQIKIKQIDPNSDPIYVTMMDMQMIYNNDWQLRPKLIILDPLNPNNNIGRATHKIREIRNAFQMAYVCIHTNKQCGNKNKCQSYRHIKQYSNPDVKYAGNKQPCCIIKRMLQSTNRIII